MRISVARKIVQLVSTATSLIGAIGIPMTHIIFPSIHCYACPWSSWVCPVGILQNFILYRVFPTYFLGSLMIYGITLGRAWCGWVCPFGFLQDIVTIVRDKVKQGKDKAADREDGAYKESGRDKRNRFSKFSKLVYSKFIFLIFTVVTAWWFVDTVFCKICPVATLEASIPYFLFSQTRLTTGFLIHLTSLAITILGFIYISRFFCRYVCPYGALISLFNKATILKLKIDKEKCRGCLVCEENCPTGVKITGRASEINSHSCIRCLKCVELCPTKALRVKLA